MSLAILIDNAKDDLLDIIKAIEEKQDDKIIFDSYETLNISILKTLKEKDEKWVYKIFTVIKKDLTKMIKEKKELTLRDIRNHLEDIFMDVEKRQLINYIVELICNDNDIFYLNKNKNIEKEEYNEDKQNNENNQINIPLEHIIDFKGFRDNQKKAINKTIEQKYISGVHDQIMGAGKTFIILKLIWEHYKLYGGNKIYPIICYRQEILKDLFFNKFNQIDENKKELWKRHDIIDLDCFRIIDKINNKDKNIKNSKKKPNILLINTDFLRIIEKANNNDELDYYVFDYDRIAYITLDECHGISANNLYDILKKIKYKHKKHIIGFSATVLRDGAEKKVQDIFSSTLNKNDDKKLNIISRYDFMDAIHDEIIVPPYYTIMEVNKTIKNKIGNSNKQIIENVLKDLIKKLPHKKIICWCRTIQQMKDYYDFFIKIFKNFKIYCSSSHDDILRYKYNINDKEFFDTDGYSIMICVNRFREGSDIKNLDMGVYLDRVKKRTTLVSMQTSGRILRIDKSKKKTHGFIVDCLINDNTERIEILTARTILCYYNKILSLSEDNIENNKNMENYKLLLDKIDTSNYNEKTKELTVKLDNSQNEKEMKIKLELTTKSFDWKYLKDILIENINKEYKITKEEEFNMIIDKLKKINKFNVECDFWKVYKSLDKNKYNLPVNFYDEYKEFFDKKTWFELMGFDISKYYKTINECKNAIKKFDKYHNEIITNKIYDKLRRKDNKLPPFPEEYFKNKGFTTIKKEFNNIKNNLL